MSARARGGSANALRETVELWDYRRRVAAIYGELRDEAGAELPAGGGAAPPGEAAWRRWRERRDALFATHPQSPIPPAERASISGLPFFDYDPAWRFEVQLDPLPPTDAAPSDAAAAGGDAIAIGHSGDGATGGRPFARARFDAAGVVYALTLYWLEGYAGGVFLAFRDATNGSGSYGGGRYLLDGAKSADLGAVAGRTVLDFNYAYHPSCVHDPRWSCPLAPPENRLPFRIPAGESFSRSSSRFSSRGLPLLEE